jgi:transposase
MFYRQGEVLGRVERRRRFSLEQKLSILAEACAPGAVISAVARRHGRLAALGVIGIPGASELPSFVAVEVAADTAEGGTSACGMCRHRWGACQRRCRRRRSGRTGPG